MAHTESEADDGPLLAGIVARLQYLVVLSRPRFWFYLAGPVVVGVVYAADTPAELFTPTTIALFLYFLLPANVYLYGINDRFDADIDEENPKKEGREARYDGGPLVGLVIALSGFGLVGLGLLVDPLAWLWLLAYAVLATEYSAPPFRFKTTPGLDSLSNGLYVLPGVVAYTTVAGAQPPLLVIVGAWLWSMAMHTFSAIPDIEPDREAGIDTTATALGARRTYAYCGLVWLLSAIAFGLQDPRAGFLLGLYPILLGAIATLDVAVDRAYWWYPAINTTVGAVLTLWALWQLVPPSSLL
jgi:4-hydroxybenzoate polyprenyltransferase